MWPSMDNPRPVVLSLLSKVSSEQIGKTMVLLKLEPVFAFYVFVCSLNTFEVVLRKSAWPQGKQHS